MNNSLTTQERRTLETRSKSSFAMMIKIIILGLMNALAIWAVLVLFQDQQYGMLTALVVGSLVIDYIYISDRVYSWRFILPGTIFLALMVIYPIVFTIYVAFTNYGTGHLLSKAMAIEQYTSRYMLREDFPIYDVEVFKDESEDFAFLLTDSEGRQLVAVEGKAVLLENTSLQPVDADADGVYDRLGDYERQSTLSIFPYLNKLQKLSFEHEGLELKMRSPQEFGYYSRRYQYDPAWDVITDFETETDYYAQDGNFISKNQDVLDIGFKTTVGWRNFKNLFTDRRYLEPFVRVFIWTIMFALLSVAETFVLGLLLAVLLNDPKVKLRGLYRSILIIPYAMPAVITCLIWRGLFSTETGIINNILLLPLFGKAIPWFQDPFWAKVAVLIVNLWLGYPYMMLICTGALQSIPGELYEAAMVDGATGWRKFQTITFPLLLSQLTPLLISCFAYNFNNLNVIYLVTKGRPAIAGAITPTGATDILISYTYRMAFESGSGGDYGLAAAVSLIIFFIISGITMLNFKYLRAFEEVPQYD
ncbi:MAG TPA: maltose ABC transporter permease MalF [Firmicutes bacterium]|jgi:ABC-type sugar transport system permease subunit|nr:maltose ABC transporter permease MalF [Bacillota bacterium]